MERQVATRKSGNGDTTINTCRFAGNLEAAFP